MTKPYEFLIGCDPELFVRSVSNDSFVSAHDLIPGTKMHPFKVPGGAIQVDGTAAEFNINPASSEEEFLLNIELVLSDLSDRVEQDGFTDNYLSVEPSAFYEPNYFNALPVEAKLMGCEPDFDAYTGRENIPPETDEPFRTAGGHIHIGWGEFFDSHDPSHFDLCCDVVKQLDALLYPVSMLWDEDETRRKLYGKKGSFRPKPYGVEYRPLSCAWLKSIPTRKFVYNQTVFAVDLLMNRGVKAYVS